MQYGLVVKHILLLLLLRNVLEPCFVVGAFGHLFQDPQERSNSTALKSDPFFATWQDGEINQLSNEVKSNALQTFQSGTICPQFDYL